MSWLSKEEEKKGNKNFILEKPISGDKSQSMDAAFSTFTIDSTVVKSFVQNNEQKTNIWRDSFCNFIKQSKILLWMDGIVLISICIAIAGGFTIPIIIYAADTRADTNEDGNNTAGSLGFSDFNFDSCQNATSQVCYNTD